jgi:hypothetical protein
MFVKYLANSRRKKVWFKRASSTPSCFYATNLEENPFETILPESLSAPHQSDFFHYNISATFLWAYITFMCILSEEWISLIFSLCLLREPPVRGKHRRAWHKTGTRPGVDVMIKIFGDFRQFSAKKLAFSQKPMLWSKFLHNLLALLRIKNAIFCNFFRRKYFKNHNIGPRCRFGWSTCFPHCCWAKLNHRTLPSNPLPQKLETIVRARAIPPVTLNHRANACSCFLR